MTAGLMRRVASFTNARGQKFLGVPVLASALQQSKRTLANVHGKDPAMSEAWFNSSAPCLSPAGSPVSDHIPPDERTLKLGKTIRVLHERLPTLLHSPLPQEILSPQITLYLFPSTHPHLPTVRGKIAYTAALWTAPVAWGRVPVLGNVKLIILSERMVRNGGGSVSADMGCEKLIVRWKSSGNSKDGETSGAYGGLSASERVSKVKDMLGSGYAEAEEFCGLFIFEFDEEGRIAKHTIEHVEEGGSWDKMTKVISVTDWLLGRAWRKKGEEEGSSGLALGYCAEQSRVGDKEDKK